MIEVISGQVGSGKTTYLAKVAERLLLRNQRLMKDTGNLRLLRSNVPFSPLIVEKYAGMIEPFADLYSMPRWKDCDIVIDELSIFFDSHEWERTTRDVKAWLRLHRHYHVDIYGATQDFLTVDKSFRRLVKTLRHVERIFSYGEPKLEGKKKKYPFLMSRIAQVDPSMWEVEKEYYKYIPLTSSIEIFTKKDFSIFDTHADHPEVPLPPLRKEVRVCPEDGFSRTKYI